MGEVRFGDVFSRTWKLFKDYKRLFIYLAIFFTLVPYLFGLVYGMSFLPVDFFEQFDYALENDPSLGIFSDYIIPLLPVTIFGFLVGILFSCCVIVSASKKKEDSFGTSLSGAWSVYGGYLLFSIVSLIFIGLLLLLFVIPGIIFLVYWIVAAFIFIIERKGIIESLKTSKRMVSGRWWKTFWHLILLILCFLVFFLVLEILNGVLFILFITTPENIFLVLGLVFDIIYEVLNSLVTIFGTLFWYNYYLALKKGKTSKK